ncbi:hypothetical protein [Acinetobacter terrae]|jgi:hypothetical protein|uniref:Uncharacterized protein n=1 Tax=Acinetobacter terrae TaxID=2731247 RepID=A0A4R0EPG3_9GAMM|nr:hypothetical protein [Acinetobacter terrae]NNH14901.1 hypothetical protein [Acinetobacter terrae]OAL80217.1 hypothetical protein AY608_04890 [Acinetobacter terrae]TCB60999.1 hypothetical protein E0H85_03885 [Acinetobacter terrae]
MNRFLKYLIIFAIGFALWNYWLKPDKGISDAADYQTTAGIHQFNGYSMTNLQPYTGEFRVLSKENYNFGRESEISPVDFALGWDKMADPQVYQQLSIRQSNRWYHWRYENSPPIPVREIEMQSANTHLIPASKQIAKQLKAIDQDDLIYLKGQLVEVKSSDGWTWRSSLSREDTGGGACELMLVEEVRVISNL